MTAPRSTIPGFRKWLQAVPQPAKLKCDDTELRVGTTNKRWHDAENSVVALAPATVYALDNTGAVLRVFSLRAEEERSEPLESQKEAWPATPEAQMAQIICASNDRAASRHEAAYKMAFSSLIQMYEAQTVRLEEALGRAARAEAAVLKLAKPRVQEVLVEAETDEDQSTALLTQVLGGALVQMTQGNGGAKQ